MSHFRLIAFVTAVTLAVAPTISLANPSSERDARLRAAAAWMDYQLNDQFIPGGSVAVISDQELVWSHAYGFSDVASGKRMTADNSYSICSISKLFTSIAVMTLVEEGKISLDAPLAKYLEGFSIAPTDEALNSPITIRQLLSHSAGLPRETSGTHWNVIEDMPTSTEVFDMLNEQQRLYTPHTNFQYSNLGMSLLGNLVAEVSGKSYHAYVQDKILGPLGLTGISSELPMDYDGGRFAKGYKYHDGKAERDFWPPYQMNGYAPAAGYAASVTDLAKFASWHFRLLESGQTEVLKRDTLREMQRVQFTDPYDPQTADVGLGYMYRTLGGEVAIGHGGYCPGYRAELAMRPAKKFAIVAMVNTNDVSPSAIANGIAEIVSDAVLAATEVSDEGDTVDSAVANHDLYQYEGLYNESGYDGGSYFVPSGKELVLISLASSNPGKNATTYEHIQGDEFRRKRKEGDLGETLTFSRDADGKIVSYASHGYVQKKVD